MTRIIQLALFIFFVTATSLGHCAVILQYHHVSEETPSSTSISPAQFERHLRYLTDNNYKVIALNELVSALTNKQKIADKTVVITFDDAYLNILTNAKPLLDKYNFPFTIFINPGIVNTGNKNYLSWAQLKSMSNDGVLLANHGFEHDSLARVPENVTQTQWLKHQAALLIESENIIKRETGQSWKYFAYPYGEYTPEIQQWINKLGYIAFSQQSGAVGPHADFTALPRFPASQPYDKLASLRDKLRSLPFDIQIDDAEKATIYEYQAVKKARFKVNNDDFKRSQLNCYISGLGKQKIDWLNDNEFSITFNAPLPTGRVRSNCTAPSIKNPGRYYWYSRPWFILKPGKIWYPL